MKQEYKRAEQKGELDQSLFTQKEWQTIQNLIHREDGSVSMLRSLGIVRKISPYIPDSAKRVLIGVLRRTEAVVKKGIKLLKK